MSSSGRKQPQKLSVVPFLDRRSYLKPSNAEVFKHQMGDGLLEANCNLFRKDLKGHFGCVNAIEFSNGGGEWIVSGGDDRRVLLWNVEKALNGRGATAVMKGQHHSNIFCLAFDNSNARIFSGGNDEQVIVHDVTSGETVNVFIHQDALYGLSVDPLNDNVFASACDDGQVLIYDIRQPASEDPFVLASFDINPMHAVMYNPVDSRLVATANAKQGVALWDVRKPKSPVKVYGLKQESCMSVRFNSSGDRLLALRRRLPPVLYDIGSEKPLMQFGHSGYYNSCTMKSCCFAGSQDQYVLSGSDDFRLYMWKIPDEIPPERWNRHADFVLDGHRSIVNQVRSNKDNCLIISSGVEKIIKAWSPFKISDDDGVDSTTTNARLIYTHEDYVDLLVRNGPVMTHDYSNESMEEDQRMMAFFDSLVQRELEEASSDDDDDGVMDSGSEIVNDVLSDTDSSTTRSDFEVTSSPFSLVPYPMTPSGLNVEIRNATLHVDLGTKHDGQDTSSSSSASDAFAGDVTSSAISHSSTTTTTSHSDGVHDEGECSDSSYSSVGFRNALAKMEETEGVKVAVKRLKRLRNAVADDSDSEHSVGFPDSKRRRAVKVKPKSSSASEVEDGIVKDTLLDERVESGRAQSQDVMQQTISNEIQQTSIVASKQNVNEHTNESSAGSNHLNGVMSDDLQIDACNVYSANCNLALSEKQNPSNNGVAKSQTVDSANSNGVSSTNESFRHAKSRGNSSGRKYRVSRRKSKSSDSDSE